MFNQNEAQIIEGINTIPIFNIDNVRGKCIVTPNGNIQSLVLADDIAREGGLLNPSVKIRATSGTKNNEQIRDTYVTKIYSYQTIIWNRFNKYLNDSIPSIQQYNPYILQYLSLPIKSGDYIPLEIALVVLMHLNSKKARDFQVILATRIAPELTAKAIQAYKQQLQQYQQQVSYYQDMVDTDQLYSTTEVASEFEMSAQQLRQILQSMNIIYPCNKTWQISQCYKHFDFVRNKYNTNIPDHPYWTNAGREFLINLLTKYGYQLHQDNRTLKIVMIFDKQQEI